MAEKKQTPTSNRLWIGFGIGCGVLLLLVVCAGGGGVGIWYWKKAPVDATPDKGLAGNDTKPKPPPVVKAKEPIGKVPEAKMQAQRSVWTLKFRPPPGYASFPNPSFTRKSTDRPPLDWPRRDIESYYFEKIRWDGSGSYTFHVERFPLRGPVDTVEFLKAETRPPQRYSLIEYIQKPQAVEINGLDGARHWLHERRVDDNKKVVDSIIHVQYFFHVDDKGYNFYAQIWGRTEEAARREAENVDVSICTAQRGP